MQPTERDDGQPKPSDAEIARGTAEDARQIALMLLADTPMGAELWLDMGEVEQSDDPTLVQRYAIKLVKREAGVVEIEGAFATLKEKRVIETIVYRLTLGPNGDILAFEKITDGELVADLDSEGDPYEDPDHLATTYLNALRSGLFYTLQERLDELDRRETERLKAQGAITYGEGGVNSLLGRKPPCLN